MSDRTPASPRQIKFILALCGQLDMSDAVRDYHCQRRFGRALHELDIREASDLITQLKQWEHVPADLQADAAGQLDMFGGAA